MHVYDECELEKISTYRDFRQVRTEEKCEVSNEAENYFISNFRRL